jgi:hypothetical protein
MINSIGIRLASLSNRTQRYKKHSTKKNAA